jgi:hypothetical protein
MLWLSFAEILRRIAYPVEPFGFEYVQGDLPPPSVEGNCHRLGKQAHLLEEANRHLVNVLQYLHRPAPSPMAAFRWPIQELRLKSKLAGLASSGATTVCGTAFSMTQAWLLEPGRANALFAFW